MLAVNKGASVPLHVASRLWLELATARLPGYQSRELSKRERSKGKEAEASLLLIPLVSTATRLAQIQGQGN